MSCQRANATGISNMLSRLENDELKIAPQMRRACYTLKQKDRSFSTIVHRTTMYWIVGGSFFLGIIRVGLLRRLDGFDSDANDADVGYEMQRRCLCREY